MLHASLFMGEHDVQAARKFPLHHQVKKAGLLGGLHAEEASGSPAD
jgi:hypothetical protein